VARLYFIKTVMWQDCILSKLSCGKIIFYQNCHVARLYFIKTVMWQDYILSDNKTSTAIARIILDIFLTMTRSFYMTDTPRGELESPDRRTQGSGGGAGGERKQQLMVESLHTC